MKRGVALFNRFDIVLKPTKPHPGRELEKIGEGCRFTNGTFAYVTRKVAGAGSVMGTFCDSVEMVTRAVGFNGQLVTPGHTVQINWVDGDPPSDDPWA